MKESLQHISYGFRKVSYLLKFSNRKTLGIKVLPDSSVVVIAPLNSKFPEISKKVHLKAPWIIRQQSYFQSYQPYTPARKYINGESHLYLGRQYKLSVNKSEKEFVKFISGQLQIFSKKTEIKALEKLLASWYKIRAEKVFNEVVANSYEQFKRYKIPYPTIQIRAMKKRWGSCTSSGKIILNTELIKAPKASIEYVVIHELCHMVHPNHTKAFRNLQEKMMPDWKKWKERLEYFLA